LRDMLRNRETLGVRWVDPLGRNDIDVVDAIREFMGRRVIVQTVINGMTFDGSTAEPMQVASAMRRRLRSRDGNFAFVVVAVVTESHAEPYRPEVAIKATPYHSGAPTLERKAPRMQSARSASGRFGKSGSDFIPRSTTATKALQELDYFTVRSYGLITPGL
jgi:hypothetical protein